MRTYRIITCMLAIACMTAVAHAQVMQSTSYRIESDSMNFGGSRSSSGSYSLEDTAGEIATGESSSTSYRLGAGYQQTLVDYLSMTAPSNVTMSPSLGGLTGGTSNGSTSVTVTTDDAAGYQLLVSATNNPAMQGSASTSISNYAPSGADPDFTFTVAAGDARFGFSPEGIDIASRFKDNGSACGVGSSDASLSCWDGLSTTPVAVSSRASANHPTGTETTLRFRVGVGANAGVVEGLYSATTTITAVAL